MHLKTVILSVSLLIVAIGAGKEKTHKRGAEKGKKIHSSGAGREYLRRLAPYRPAQHIDIGIRDFHIPSKHIYSSAGVSHAPNKEKHGSKKTGSHRKCSKGKKCKTEKRIPEVKCKQEKKHKNCKKPKDYRKKGISSRHVYKSASSSSVSHRSISIKICFSEEDDALLGSCDQPAVVFHRRHFSRHLNRRRLPCPHTSTCTNFPAPSCTPIALLTPLPTHPNPEQ